MQYLYWLWGLLLQLWGKELGDWLVVHRFAEYFTDVDIVGWSFEVIRDRLVISFVFIFCGSY